MSTSGYAEAVVTVHGLATRYLSAGDPDRPTVVLLHDGAWGASADVTWGAMIPTIAQQYHVIAPDLLGWGATSKTVALDASPFAFRLAHIFALLDTVGVDDRRVHLAGSSFGGSLALRALTHDLYSSRVASATTIAGTGGPWRSAVSSQLAAFDGTALDMERLVRLLCGAFPGSAQQVADRLAWAAVPGHYASMLAPRAVVPEGLRRPRPADPYPEPLRATSTPVLLVTGSDDVLVEPDWTSRLQEFVPHADAVTIQTRHLPSVTHPHELWEAMAAFLARAAAEPVVASASHRR